MDRSRISSRTVTKKIRLKSPSLKWCCAVSAVALWVPSSGELRPSQSLAASDALVHCVKGQICRAELEKWSSHMSKEPEATVEEAHMFDLDCFLSDISDTLFTMTQKPCPWASDRHNSEWGGRVYVDSGTLHIYTVPGKSFDWYCILLRTSDSEQVLG